VKILFSPLGHGFLLIPCPSFSRENEPHRRGFRRNDGSGFVSLQKGDKTLTRNKGVCALTCLRRYYVTSDKIYVAC
jgi:hypothetical protein